MRYCVAAAVAGAPSHPLPADPIDGRLRPASARRDGRPQRGGVRRRGADRHRVPRIPAQDGRPLPHLAPPLVRLRPQQALAHLLHGPERDEGTRWHLLPGDRAGVRRPPEEREEPQQPADVLREDVRPHLLPGRTVRRGNEDLDRRDLHRRRGIPGV